VLSAWTAPLPLILPPSTRARYIGSGRSLANLNTEKHIRMVRLTGAPRQRGEQLGDAARDEIISNIAIYTEWFKAHAGIDWPSAQAMSAGYLDALAGRFPALHDELRGIATGADLPVTAIGALNARTEIAYRAVGDMYHGPLLGECTSVAAGSRATHDGSVLIAENWDWIVDVLPNTLRCHVQLESGIEILTFTEAGMLAKFGVNSEGLGLCNNLLASNRNGEGQTFHALARAVLETHSLSAGLSAVSGSVRAGAGNFMLASSSTGEVCDLEWAPGNYEVIQSDLDVLAHANNFTVVMPGIVDRAKFLPSASPGTFLRTQRASAFLRERAGGVTVADLKKLLADHKEYPESICRHMDPRFAQDVFGQSNVSVIFDLTKQMYHYTYGPPCENIYSSEAFPWAREGVDGV
jgi:isopenicillin-N N-acyltransferase-like protein